MVLLRAQPEEIRLCLSAEGRDFTVSYSHEYNAIESLIGCAYHEAALKMHLADSELCILYTLHTHGPGCLQSAMLRMPPEHRPIMDATAAPSALRIQFRMNEPHMIGAPIRIIRP